MNSFLHRTTKAILATAVVLVLNHHARAAAPAFTPGKLAVMQLGDGGTNRGPFAPSDLLGSRQNPIFIAQFDPNGVNQTNGSVVILIPTNGPGAMLINGNAGTEGNLSLAGDKSRLVFASYQGDILSIATGQPTAPSNLSYDRGIGTLDAFGNYENPYRGGSWYGVATGKTNPRGTASDGLGNFWGCGNGYGSLFFNATTTPDPIQIQNLGLATSCVKILNGRVLTSIKNSESANLYPAGVYSYVDFNNQPVAYPMAASFLHLEIPANSTYNSCIGFDVSPDNTVAYMADNGKGIQKYVKSGTDWLLAYNLSIPGYTNAVSGILANVTNTNVLVGAFALTVDWTGANPVVYATTADSALNNGNGAPYYGNRVIRINDTNTVTSGANIIITTNMNILTTVARPGLDVAGHQITNVVYKSVVFTPDLSPTITSNPADWSAVVGDNVGFVVGATSPSPNPLSYQWQKGGTDLLNQTNSTLTLNSVALGDNATTYRCVVTNDFGAVTSSIATLTVQSVATLPVLAAAQQITNVVTASQSFTANFTSGTDPKGGYQWFHDGVPLTDGPTVSGSTSRTLALTLVATSDAGAYSVSVTNVAGLTSNLVANFVVNYAKPVMIQPPVPIITFYGRSVTNSAYCFGSSLSYQWYKSTKSNTLSGTTLTLLSDGGEFSGATTANLVITGATNSSATNYAVIITNPGGSITSAPVSLIVQTAPPHTFVAYTNQTYTQNFNTLPIPGQSSAEGANPLHIAISCTNYLQMIANTNPALSSTLFADVTYSTDNPLDFGYPIIPVGGIGGVGLGNSMAGWYAWAANSLVFAAGKGDQTQGAVVDNGGNYYQLDGYTLDSVTNRSLGLVASTKTGEDAIGVAFINKTTNTLNKINLSYLGELWRNKSVQQPLKFGYFVDGLGTNSTLQPVQWDNTNGLIYVPSLDVSFAAGTDSIRVGSVASNQVSLTASNLTITNWPPGAALWLVWRAQAIGNAQDVAIDNLSFSAAPTVTVVPPTLPITITPSSTVLSGGALQFGFTNATGVSFSILATTNIALPLNQWQNLGAPTEGPAGHYQFTDPAAASKPQQFYIISQP